MRIYKISQTANTELLLHISGILTNRVTYGLDGQTAVYDKTTIEKLLTRISEELDV